MKKIILFASLLLLNSCKTRLITNQEQKGDYMFEKYDFNKLEYDYKEFKIHEHSFSYIFKDGTLVSLFAHGISTFPPKPAFYSIEKEFYKNDFIKEKGKYLSSTNIKIGVWTYFDEQGKMIREEDEDKKFSAFGYNELLTFLDQEKVINLRTGKNRENLHISIRNLPLKERKVWSITSYTDSTESKGVKYYLDFATGEILIKYAIVGWNGGTEFKYTTIIDNTAIYKTENGIDYTEPEWKEHLKNKEEGIYYYNNDDNNNKPNNTNYSLLIVLLILAFAVIFGGFIYITNHSRSLLQP